MIRSEIQFCVLVTSVTCTWVVGLGDGAGSFQYQGVLLLLHIVGQGPAVLAAGVGRVGCIFYIFIYLPFLMSCLLGDG